MKRTSITTKIQSARRAAKLNEIVSEANIVNNVWQVINTCTIQNVVNYHQGNDITLEVEADGSFKITLTGQSETFPRSTSSKTIAKAMNELYFTPEMENDYDNIIKEDTLNNEAEQAVGKLLNELF